MKRRCQKSWITTTVVLAGGMLASCLTVSADAAEPVAWAPSREDAVIVDSLAAAYPAEILPDVVTGQRVDTGSRVLRRPAGLSRPAPARLYGKPTSQIIAGEPLPGVVGTPIASDVIVEGSILGDGTIIDGGFIDGGVTGGDCCGLCGGVACPGDCCGNWNNCGPVHPCCLLPRPSFVGFEFFGGVQGFTGPANRGGSGSFGFHEGFNWGIPLCGCLAGQWGVHATQSTFDGNYLTTDDRNQLFLSGGLFRRVDWGLQWAGVIDYLHDEWDYEADLIQIRGELSWLWECKHEVGFWFTAGVHESNNMQVQQPVTLAENEGIGFQQQPLTFETNDLYAIFYRRQFSCGGEGRLFGGFTSDHQGLVGGDIQVPINPCWSLRSGFLYVVPDDRDGNDVPNFVEETWNVGISLVWTPRARDACGPKNYLRPLLNVADNGSFATRVVRE
jgi:hypothetical protein